MERKPNLIIVEIRDNTAVKSVVFNDLSCVIQAPIHNIDAINPQSTKLYELRQKCKEESNSLEASFFYLNHDLANEVIRRKLATRSDIFRAN